nr:sensor domain-containing diguanylate cyclase [Spirochaetota bacterium]
MIQYNKKRLIGILSVVLVSGFLITSLASYYVARSTLRSRIEHSELPLTSDNIYSEIQRDLLRPVFISSLMATDTFLRDWVLNGERGNNHITKYLKEIKLKYNTFTSFFVSEKTRRYYYAGGILKKVRPDEPRDAWYFRVREMDTLYEINVDPDMANRDAMTIFVNYKVYGYNNNYIGATGVGLTVSAVKKLIESYQARYERTVYFINSKGKIVLHGSAFSRTSRNIRGTPGISEHSTEILSKKSSTFSYQHRGNTVHVNTRFIPEFQWYLVVEQTEAKAIADIRNALIVNLALCVLITLVVIFLTNIAISYYQKRLEKMATIDSLTETYNRYAFETLFSQIIRELQREHEPVSIVLFDLDLFKDVNDKYGHLAGDSVIRGVAGVVQDSIRDSDVLCRWGGEEV